MQLDDQFDSTTFVLNNGYGQGFEGTLWQDARGG